MSKPPRVQSPRTAPRGRSGLLFWGAVVALFAVAAVVAVLVGRGGDDGGSDAQAVEAGSVEVAGARLPALGQGEDAAVGTEAPGLTGTGLDGGELSIPAGEGPRALLFLAHWCPHCQAEVPLIVDWLEAGGAPEGVELYAVATANDPDAPNYPPSSWLAEEGWQVPTLVDDETQAAAQAYGVSGFPFFVFVDAEGEVVGRHAGGLGVEALEQRLAAIAGA